MLRHPLPLPISFIALILLAIISLPAGAATFTVTNLNDSGPGSLRQAILDANNNSSGYNPHTIGFQAGLSGTITLTSGELIICSDLTIQGPGRNVLAISGDHTSRIFYLPSRYNDDSCGGTLILNGLTIKNGYALDGGGIFGETHISVINSTLSGNSATRDGGGIYIDDGELIVSNSTLSGNSATGDGGGIYINDGELTVSNSTLSGNSATGDGGGIYGDNLTITNSTLTSNRAT